MIRKLCLIMITSILVLSGCMATTSTEEVEPTESELSDAELIGQFATYVDAVNRDIDENEGTPITEQSLNFIEEHMDIFMNHEEVPENLINADIDYRHLGKDIEKYSGTLFQDDGVIIDIEEVEDESLEKTFSIIHIQNPETSTNYYVLYIGVVDFLEDDYIEFVGLPLMDTQFENVGGGTTQLFMILASHLKKIE